jgi:hypothetical protein
MGNVLELINTLYLSFAAAILPSLLPSPGCAAITPVRLCKDIISKHCRRRIAKQDKSVNTCLGNTRIKDGGKQIIAISCGRYH